MLRTRVLTALVLAPLAIAIILFLPPAYFAVVTAIAFAGAQWEWTGLLTLRSNTLRWLAPLVLLILLALIHYGANTRTLPATVIVLGLIWWLTSLIWLRHPDWASGTSGQAGLGKLVVGFLVLVPAWVALNHIQGSPAYGPGWTLLALCVVAAADIGAYFSGRAFGKRKLAPRISPGKTRAGALGAVFAGMATAIVGALLLGVHDLRLVAITALGCVTVAAAIVGDMLESLLKRHAAIKDSGTLFPGHGGLLDRLDSWFAALPVFAAGLMLIGH